MEYKTSNRDVSPAAGSIKVPTPTTAITQIKGPRITSLTWWTFLMSGLVVSLPWGVITSCVAFFESRLKGTSYATSFLSHFASLYLISKFVVMLTSMRMQRVIKPTMQIIIGTIGILMAMISFTIMAIASPKIAPQQFYATSITLSVIMSALGALLEAGIYHLAGLLRTVNQVMVGQSLSGALGALMALIFTSFQLSSPGAVAAGAFASVSIITMLSSLMLHKCNYFQQLPVRDKEEYKVEEEEEFRFRQFWKIARKCWPEVMATIVGSSCQLLVSPFLVSRTISVRSETFFQRDLFRPLAFLLAALADLLSKILTLTPSMRLLSLPVLWLNLGRCLFIPLFLMGNVRKGGGEPFFSNMTSGILANDVIYFILVIVFCFVGGYLHIITNLKALQKVSLKERGHLSAGLAVIGLGGAILGALMSAMIAAIWL